MTKAEIKLNQIIHTAYFSRPLLAMWGDGRRVMTGLYDAFRPLGAKFTDMRVEGIGPNDQVVIVPLGNTAVHRFRFDRVETTFSGFAQSDVERIPGILDASLSWIRNNSDMHVESHKFVYHTHCLLQGESTDTFLVRIGPKGPAGGVEEGHGAIFYWSVPGKGWKTQVILDKSIAIPGGLFLMFTLATAGNKIDFAELIKDAQEYLSSLLKEFGLEFLEI